MDDVRNSYEVVMSPELSDRWAALSYGDSRRLTRRLARAARTAFAQPTVWPKGPPGLHRGEHRALVDSLWVHYRINDASLTLKVLGFGVV